MGNFQAFALCLLFRVPCSFFLALVFDAAMSLECLIFIFRRFLFIIFLGSIFWLLSRWSFLHIECFSFFSNADGPSRKTDILLEGVQSESVHLHACILLHASSCCRPISSQSPAVNMCPTCSELCFGISRFFQSITGRWYGLVMFSPFAHFCP